MADAGCRLVQKGARSEREREKVGQSDITGKRILIT